jgi:hypothetical protein
MLRTRVWSSTPLLRSHRLSAIYFVVVVGDPQITLHEEPKLSVELEGTSLTIVEELLLEGNLELLSGALAGVGALLEIDIDGAEQP